MVFSTTEERRIHFDWSCGWFGEIPGQGREDDRRVQAAGGPCAGYTPSLQVSRCWIAQLGILTDARFGETVLISRTDPVIDVCLEDGSLGGLEKDGVVPVRAKVRSTGKSFVRVLIENTETDIEGLHHGTWRLDIGLNEWAHRVQLDAISAFNQDPAAQDMSDIHTQEAAANNKLKRPRYVSKEDWKRYLQQRRPEETILAGTSLRDKLLRAFQQNYLPFEPKALSEREKEAEREGKIANDGIVAPVQQLRAGDVDAVPIPTKPASMSGALIRNQVIKSWTTRYRAEGELVKAEGDPEIPLNPSQLRAIAMMLSERLSLVQGVGCGFF